MKLFVMASLLGVGLALAAGEPAPLSSPVVVAENPEASGVLTIAGALSTPEGCFYADFLKASGEPEITLRLCGENLLVPDVLRDFYDVPLKPGEKAHWTIQRVSGCYFVEVNGKPLTSVTAKTPGEIKEIVVRAQPGQFALDAASWRNVPSLNRQLFLKSKPTSDASQFLPEKTPPGKFSLSFRFLPHRTDETVKSHYGVALESGKPGVKKLQIVFWEKGVQALQGGASKWFVDFAPKLNETWHDFTVKKSDEDFYEFLLDGKYIGSFDADLEGGGGGIKFWSCSGWNLAVENPILTEK